MLKNIFLCCLILVVSNNANAGVVTLDGSDRLLSITDVNISGTLYDVNMHYSLTWLDFKALPGVTPITFTDEPSATTAANAISAEVLADASIAALFGTDDLNIPYFEGTGVPAGSVLVLQIGHNSIATYSTFPTNGLSTGIDDEAGGNDAWVSFAPAASQVPEPSSFALLGIAGLGLLARRKR